MVKYSYDSIDECFKRKNKRGRPLYVNITEAQRITNFVDLGVYTESIIDRVHLVSPKAGKSTVRSFIKNYKDGNIEMPTDAPVPTKVFDEMTDESRIDALEKRVELLEQRLSEQPTQKNVIERIRTWI